MAGRRRGGDTPEIGELIKHARHQRALTQTGLAETLCKASGSAGLRREHVARWERGRHIPSPYWRQWLGAVLDLGPERIERAVRASKLRRLGEVT